MSQKAVREFDAKRMLFAFAEARGAACLPAGAVRARRRRVARMRRRGGSSPPQWRVAEMRAGEDAPALVARCAWLDGARLVAKPDQLVKRRGKHGLVLVNKSLDECVAWCGERASGETEIDGLVGRFSHFVLEPLVPHDDAAERYVCVQSVRDGEELLFSARGGVDVGDVDAHGKRLLVPTGSTPSAADVSAALLGDVPEAERGVIADFLLLLLDFYADYDFGYLEINPFVVAPAADGGGVRVLDMAAKVDETAAFQSGDKWGELDFPAPFGKVTLPEEDYIRQLDAKTGASLKLTILNERGRVWTMVAGGGASVIFADTIVDLGFGHELANYGEYSGAPSETLTFEYANTIIKLMCKHQRADGQHKVLIIGGGIANFTNVADTFKGIARAIEAHASVLKARNIEIFVRRGGPNYQEGLQMMKQLGYRLQLPIDVYGPETHLTKICSLALFPEKHPARPRSLSGRVSPHPLRQASPAPGDETVAAADATATSDGGASDDAAPAPTNDAGAAAAADETRPLADYELTSKSSRAIVFGMQPRAVQGMLDFDHICGRSKPSVACIVYPFAGNHMTKFYWGAQEIVMQVFEKLSDACESHPDVQVLINFSSCRAVYETVDEALNFAQLKTIAIIAEGVPERRTRQLIAKSRAKGVTIIGPATVGGIKPGAFRIGNTGGMLDNVIQSKLYRPGSVGYVSRSGGLSNELNNICANVADGVYEGIAIGGDRFPGSTFADHLFRYERDPNIKMLVLLGEVGGEEEYAIADAVKNGRLSKPLVAWCIGTCAKVFPYEVQFGHAGALAQSQRQTADAKNAYLKQCGAHVPDSFEQFGDLIGSVYAQLKADGAIAPRVEPPVPAIPMDFSWAQKLGLIRKPTSFMSSVSDDRGDELTYAGMPISAIFRDGIGIGGVVSLLWFQRRLPDYCCKFIEMVLMVTADHGPAVSGAHNTIVTARAGKDLISSLCSGLLTIGQRFGGASDDAARQFTTAFDADQTPKQFVMSMRAQKKLIMGIGHKIKSVENPDMRVTILKTYVKEHFTSTPLLDYALEVERVTTAKKSNLILNVDGLIAVAFIDMLNASGAFTRTEVREFIDIGVLNGLFVLGRSIGFIAHFIDQKRLKTGLYRHDASDIAYLDAVERRR